ncbi:hypothetical protein [Nocardiopsis sp. TNDT3]|uniref:hypothetical protein n=1 Tax=Nocardiopsis sp. TNDT3 TaxID=2249354 RepID=UPI000E3E1DC6|nr:hypothetical protein [Nocardiopsis sp. TNDT3]
MNLRKKNEAADVVADLKARVQDAKALQSVADQKLLADPRLNPTTRGQADRLLSERLSTGLEMEHRRELRSVRETDRRAEEAVRAAAAVDAARAATDPAYTVLDLVRSRTRFSRLCLGASVLLSIGSAMGLEAAVTEHYTTAPDGIGYLAEVALTGMSTAAIIWAGKLAAARAFPEGRARTALVALIAVPLLISIVGSTIGSGPVGAVASLGAAAFSAMAYLVATTSAAAIEGLIARIDGRTTVTEVAEDQEEKERRAAPAPLPRLADRDRDALEVVGEELAEEVDDYLRDQDHRADGTSSTLVIPRGDDGATGDIHPATEEDGDAPGSAPVPLASAARQRSADASQRVRDYYATHPHAPVKTAARDLGMDAKTVRKYRPVGGAS